MVGCVLEYFTGLFSSFIGPQEGCSISSTIPLANTVSYVSASVVPPAEREAFLTMVVFQRAFKIVDLGVGQAGAVEDFQPLLGRLALCDVFNPLFEHFAVLYPLGVGGEALVRCPFGLAQTSRKNAKEPVICAADEDISIACSERTIGDHRS